MVAWTMEVQHQPWWTPGPVWTMWLGQGVRYNCLIRASMLFLFNTYHAVPNLRYIFQVARGSLRRSSWRKSRLFMSDATKPVFKPKKGGIPSLRWGIRLAGMSQGLSSWNMFGIEHLNSRNAFYIRKIVSLAPNNWSGLASKELWRSAVAMGPTSWGWFSIFNFLLWSTNNAIDPQGANALPCFRKNQYDGVDEFWVDVRTTGTAAYEETDVEKSKQRSHVDSFLHLITCYVQPAHLYMWWSIYIKCSKYAPTIWSHGPIRNVMPLWMAPISLATWMSYLPMPLTSLQSRLELTRTCRLLRTLVLLTRSSMNMSSSSVV